MNYKTAIIGPKDIISGFTALGVMPFDATSSDEAFSIMRDLYKKTQDTEEKYAVVLVIESLLREVSPEDMERVSGEAFPAFLGIPGKEGSSGYGEKRLRELSQKAVGSDIF